LILFFLVLLARGGHCGYSRIFDSRSSLSARTSTAQALGAQCNCRITISHSETRAQTPIPERRAQRQIRSLSSTFLAACLCEEREPGYAPGGAVTFFRVAERKSPKKGRPRCPCPLRFAPGQPAVLASGGVRANSLRSNKRGPDPPEAALLGTVRGDWEPNSPSGHRCARPQHRCQQRTWCGRRRHRGRSATSGSRFCPAEFVLRPQSRNSGCSTCCSAIHV
jgi:hypothetical protein